MKWKCEGCKFEGSPSKWKFVRATLGSEGVLMFTTKCPNCGMYCDLELKEVKPID